MNKLSPKAFLCLIAGLAAFTTVPTTAVASPQLSTSTGTPIPVNSKIKVRKLGEMVLTTGSGGEKFGLCSTGSMTGTVATNSGTAFSVNLEKVSFGGTEASGDCTSPTFNRMTFPTLPWCMQSSKTADTLEFRGGGCGEAAKPLTTIFENGSQASLQCPYEALTTQATFRTQPEIAVLTTSGLRWNAEAGKPFFCMSSFIVDTLFLIETDPESGSSEVLYIF